MAKYSRIFASKPTTINYPWPVEQSSCPLQLGFDHLFLCPAVVVAVAANSILHYEDLLMDNDESSGTTLPPPADVEFVMIMLVVSPAFYDR